MKTAQRRPEHVLADFGTELTAMIAGARVPLLIGAVGVHNLSRFYDNYGDEHGLIPVSRDLRTALQELSDVRVFYPIISDSDPTRGRYRGELFECADDRSHEIVSQRLRLLVHAEMMTGTFWRTPFSLDIATLTVDPSRDVEEIIAQLEQGLTLAAASEPIEGVYSHHAVLEKK